MTTAAASAPRTVTLALLGFGNMAREFCALAERERDSLSAEGLRELVSASGTRHAGFVDGDGVSPIPRGGLMDCPAPQPGIMCFYSPSPEGAYDGVQHCGRLRRFRAVLQSS